MKKYDVVGLTEILWSPVNSNQKVDTSTGQKLVEYIGQGYEVYQLVPMSNEQIGMIKYILRREVKQ